MDILSKGYSVLVAPPKQQSADTIILLLCDRLKHSTLLEDRRAAVFGLRGFAREYPRVSTREGS